MTINELVKSARKDSGLSQQGLANKSGVAPSTIRAIEQGVVRDPNFSTIALLAFGTGKPADFFAEAYRPTDKDLKAA